MCLRMPVSLHVGPGRLLTDDLLSGEATRMEVLTGVVHGRYDFNGEVYRNNRQKKKKHEIIVID